MLRLTFLSTCIKMCLSIVGLLLLFSQTVQAQNTGGVFPAAVNEGTRAAQYRAAIDPDNANDDFGFAQRLHYQEAINDDFMWRILGGSRKTENSDIEFDFVGAELFWEFSENIDTHKQGVRFDVTFRNQRSDRLGFNWIHQWNLPDNWHTRFVVLTGYETGGSGADGINIQTRSRVAKKLENNLTIGLENYSNYGTTDSFGSFNDQSHTIGPFVSFPLRKGTSIFGGPLFGVSRSAPDLEARLWITQSFK